jgi:hypothetical protein
VARTIPEFPAKTALSDEGGAKAGALATTDPNLASLIEAWPKLPEAIRAGILAMIRVTSS